MTPLHHAVLFVSTSCSLALCDVIATTDAPKAEFVKVLKQDLRRNNDDYLESTIAAINISNPYLLRTTTNLNIDQTKSDQYTEKTSHLFYRREPPGGNRLLNANKNNEAPQRRVFDSLVFANKNGPIKIEPPSSIKPNNLTTFMPTIRKVETRITNKPKTNTSIILTTATKPLTTSADRARLRSNIDKRTDAHHRAKVDKFKSFIKKNKELFNDFVNQKLAERGAEVTVRTQTPGRMISKLRAQVDFESGLSSEAGAKLHQRADYDDDATVSPDQLDMAPARGGLIHALRLKRRLCQRSVLIPEGPKYDSKGTAYLGAYGHKRGRDFASTEAPGLLLPLCCNCCKKSVLGCE